MLEQASKEGSAPEAAVLPGLLDPFLRVLHVNDSTDDQVLFQAACRHAQVPINWHVADSAQKGISYLQTLMDQSKRVSVCWPDLILLDIVMPEQSGFEVLKFIRTSPQLRHLPVVIFTGREFPDPRPESQTLGANFCLFKPSDFAEIVETAKQLYLIIRQFKSDSPPAPPKGQ
jgi:CheY-like chemotaxis protein